MKPIFPFIANRKYTDDSVLGLGAIKGKNCTIKDITDNVVTFEWTADDGTKREAAMTVDATTPIEDIAEAVDKWLEEHKDELHGEDGKTVFVGAADDAPEEAVLIFDPNELIGMNNYYNKAQADVRFAKSVDVGDTTKLVVSTWKDLVEAINWVYGAGMGAYRFEVDEAKKQLTIVTRSGAEIPIDISQIILNTNITEFKDMLVTSILDGQSLVWSASKKKWVNKSIDSSGMLVEAKKYTDDEIKKFNNKGSLAVDEKPTYYGGIITYKQGGETKTTDNAGTWFYYFDEQSKAVQTIFIEGTEFTIAMAGDINLDDYVAKTDLENVYDENFVDKSKVPTTAYIEELKGAIDDDLGEKVNTTDIEDSLTSDATDKPLSAKQGKVLDEEIKALIDDSADKTVEDKTYSAKKIAEAIDGVNPSWNGTKAEFEALDKSKLKDGQTVNITDDYEANNYATTEYVDEKVPTIMNNGVILNNSDVQFEYGTATTSGTERTIILKGNYTEFLDFALVKNVGFNDSIIREISLTPPNVLKFKLRTESADVTGSLTCKYKFVGIKA